METVFNFNLGDRVMISCSCEHGEVIGRAEYSNGDPSYLIRYRAADGRAVESWWGQGALRAM